MQDLEHSYRCYLALGHLPLLVCFIDLYTMRSANPSSKIDATLCDLVTRLSNFSDDHFDAQWMHLSEQELEALVIKLLQYWTEHLDGRLLGGILLEIREVDPH
jgi:hypothetical protein